MKCRILLSLAAAFFLNACMASPQTVALDYWKSRTALNAEQASSMVENSLKDDARKDLAEAQAAMKRIYPGLDSFKYDFSRVNAHAVYQTDFTAQVKISGTAAVYTDAGKPVDLDSIDETVPLKRTDAGWKIDYSWKYDPIVKQALKDLATAQDVYRRQAGTYAVHLEDLRGIYQAPPWLSMKILEAGRTKWRAIANAKTSWRIFMYDSASGGVASDPLSIAP